MTALSTSRDGNMGDDDNLAPAEIYRAAIEEYRFQAQFNWNRVQYLLAFNAAILAAAVALAAHSGSLAVLVFALGIVASVMTVLVHRIQHGYYQRTRDRVKRVEAKYVPPDARTDTTPSLAGRSKRLNVTAVIYLLLASIAVADAMGIVLTVV
ncbi:MAG: hypothetical protein FWE71_07620 [Nocardioidaceae bacterium]|nr:hypothetical protein [Nocardioidaceae bacterium]MCL2611856.1 hypothetical protein [Nocardioidaceae bacterium]